MPLRADRQFSASFFFFNFVAGASCGYSRWHLSHVYRKAPLFWRVATLSSLWPLSSSDFTLAPADALHTTRFAALRSRDAVVGPCDRLLLQRFYVLLLELSHADVTMAMQRPDDCDGQVLNS